MKKPYEQGYYDGYQDCKRFYEKLLHEVEEDKAQIKLLEYKLNDMLKEERINSKFIALGKAVKVLIEENKSKI